MSEDVIDRVQGDLAVMRRAMGLQLFFGKSILIFDLLLTAAAIGAAWVSSRMETDALQQVPFAVIMVLVPVGLYLRSQRTSHEINMHVLMSAVIYAVVWVAACGYRLADFVGPTVGTLRTALLYGTSLSILSFFSLLLVRAALIRREQYYCLGLAISTFLAGMLFPIVGQEHSYMLAHVCMAVGYLMVFAIQWSQLREAQANHAAD